MFTDDFLRAADAAESSSKFTGAQPHEFAWSSSCVAPESFLDFDFERGPLLFSHFQQLMCSPKSSEFQPRSSRCTRGRYHVPRLRWTMFRTENRMDDAFVRCFVPHHVWSCPRFLVARQKRWSAARRHSVRFDLFAISVRRYTCSTPNTNTHATHAPHCWVVWFCSSF